MNTIQIKDTDGITRYIPAENFVRAYAENDLQIYGMSLAAVRALRKEYLFLGGAMPITEESVKQTFKK